MTDSLASPAADAPPPDPDCAAAEPSPEVPDTADATEEASPSVAESSPPAGAASRLLRGVPVTAPAVVLTALMAASFLMFVLIEPTPRWIALLGAGTVAISMEGVLRAARGRVFALGVDPLPFLFLPTLFALAVPVFIEYNLRGYWVVPGALLGALLLGAVVVAETASVREFDPAHEAARATASAAAYFVAFALFSLTYTFQVALLPAAVAAGMVATLLAIELLREGEVDPLETLGLALLTGGMIAELRWLLHYLPVGGHLAALALLLGFYFVSGVLHSHVIRRLTGLVAAQYAVITGIGVAVVWGASAAGLG